MKCTCGNKEIRVWDWNGKDEAIGQEGIAQCKKCGKYYKCKIICVEEEA